MTMSELLAELMLEYQSRPGQGYAGSMSRKNVEELKEWMETWNDEPSPT
jgi:hypothetical protein